MSDSYRVRIPAAVELDFDCAGVQEYESEWHVFFDSFAEAESCALRFDSIVEVVADENWSAALQAQWMPIPIGKRFWLAPATWDGVTPEGRIRLDMVPGNVFGGGDHPTTQLCLELLEEVAFESMRIAAHAATPPQPPIARSGPHETMNVAVAQQRRDRKGAHPPQPVQLTECSAPGNLSLNGARIADIGTGTGILTRAARALGAQAIGCDIDPAAFVDFIGSANALRSGAFDVVIANIHLGVLREIAADLRRLGGAMLLSGFLPEQRDEVADLFGPPRELKTKDGWCAGWYGVTSGLRQ